MNYKVPKKSEWHRRFAWIPVTVGYDNEDVLYGNIVKVWWDYYESRKIGLGEERWVENRPCGGSVVVAKHFTS